jgi:hypothetical protein
MLIPGFPICYDFVSVFYMWLIVVLRERIVYLQACNEFANKGNNKITELRTILQRESQNS